MTFIESVDRRLYRAKVQGRDRIVAETGGNPLRLLEVPREMSSGELAGGYGVPHVGGPLEERYMRLD